MARPTFMRHRKFRRLCRELGLPRYACRGLMEMIWDDANESGEPILGDEVDVESAADWDGEPGELARAVVAAGLVDCLDDGRYRIHEFWEHCPAYVRKRREREKQRKIVASRLVSDETTAVSDGRTAPNGSTPTPTPTPSPTPTTDSSEPAADGGSEPVAVWIPVNGGKMAAPQGIPLRGKNGTAEAGVTERKVREYSRAYQKPEKWVLAELLKARQWSLDNSARRKTPRGVLAFVNRWMDRATNRPAAGRGGGRTKANMGRLSAEDQADAERMRF